MGIEAPDIEISHAVKHTYVHTYKRMMRVNTYINRTNDKSDSGLWTRRDARETRCLITGRNHPDPGTVDGCQALPIDDGFARRSGSMYLSLYYR